MCRRFGCLFALCCCAENPRFRFIATLIIGVPKEIRTETHAMCVSVLQLRHYDPVCTQPRNSIEIETEGLLAHWMTRWCPGSRQGVTRSSGKMPWGIG